MINLTDTFSFLCSIDEGVLKIANVYPGLKFQYSTDLKTWKNVEDVSDLEGEIMLRTRSENSTFFQREGFTVGRMCVLLIRLWAFFWHSAVFHCL